MDAEILADLYANGPDVFVAGGNKLLSIESLDKAGYKYVDNIGDLQKNYEGMIALMEECNQPLDVIVLPEYCDIPAAQSGKKAYWDAIEKYNQPVLQKAKELAVRCNSNVFINCAYNHESGLRNTTHVIDRQGNVVGRYYKAHPAPKEDKPESVGGLDMNSSYSKPGAMPYVIELE